VRTREQVDETLTDNTGPNNTDNWKYFVGCYKGESAIAESDAVDADIADACIDGRNTRVPGIDSSGTAEDADTTALPTAAESSDSSASRSDNSACFPADAMVLLESGESRRMDMLSVGDRVHVGRGVFSDVFMWTHKSSDVVTEFVKMTTRTGKSISATPGHYIYINGDVAQAQTARVGDAVELGDGVADFVCHVARAAGTGIFNPQTLHGDIVVRASTYTTAVEPWVGHAALAVLRAAYTVLGWSAAVAENGAPSWAARVMPSGAE
jgi:desert hedgehog